MRNIPSFRRRGRRRSRSTSRRQQEGKRKSKPQKQEREVEQNPRNYGCCGASVGFSPVSHLSGRTPPSILRESRTQHMICCCLPACLAWPFFLRETGRSSWMDGSQVCFFLRETGPSSWMDGSQFWKPLRLSSMAPASTTVYPGVSFDSVKPCVTLFASRTACVSNVFFGSVDSLWPCICKTCISVDFAPASAQN